MKDEPLEHNIVSLYHLRGWSIRRLAGDFGISRGRVRRILGRHESRRESGDEPKARVQRASKLDPYKEYIGELLATYTDPPPTIERIFELIVEKGYRGGRTILGHYLSGIRGKKAKEPVYCVQESPGQRASHDWSEYYLEFSDTGQKQKVIFFSFILHYSRRQYIEPVEDMSRSRLLDCLINAFIYLDGVPRQIKSDNQKACVDRWEYGRAVFNKTYLGFATHYRFAPLAIRPGRPVENLKIERPFYYLETNFLNARRFANPGDLKQQLLRWLAEVNDQRIHRTTGKKPLDLYTEELPDLQALPRQHYDTSQTDYRLVNNEACVAWQGYFYRVPAHYMNQQCLVREYKGRLTIYGPGHEPILQYPVAEPGRQDKYVGQRPGPARPAPGQDMAQVLERLQALGPVMAQYVEQVKKHKPGSWRHHLKKVLALKVTYHSQDMVRAVQRAMNYKVYESAAVQTFLQVNAPKKNEDTLWPPSNTRKP